jgi:hypothetical protein
MKRAFRTVDSVSDEQANGTSIQRQQELIDAHAKAHGIQIVETLEDNGKSASKGEHIP